MTSIWRNYIQTLLIIGIIIISWSYWAVTVVKLFSADLPDFKVYYQTAQLSLQRITPEFGLGKFIYPPSAALLLTPIALVNFTVAKELWTVINLSCLGGIIWLVLIQIRQKSLLNFLLIFCISVWFFPIKFTLGMGQINLIVCLFVVAAFNFSTKNQLISSLFLGIAAAIKLGPILSIGYEIRKRKWLAAIGTIIIFGLVNILAGKWFGFTSWQNFYLSLSKLPTLGNDSYFNQGLSGLLARINITGMMAIITMLIWNFYWWIKCWIVTSKLGSLERSAGEWYLWLATMVGTSGLVWQHHLIFFLPLLIFIFFSQNLNFSKRMILLVGWFLLTSNIKSIAIQNSTSLALFTSSHGFWGMLIILWLGHQIVADIEKKPPTNSSLALESSL